MASLKALKIRIGSVKSTQKITKAMKMVAAAKLRRAQEAAVAARPYAQRLEKVMASLASKISVSESSPKLLAGTGKNQRHLLIIATSERGLAGAFNSNIVRAARRKAEELIGQGKSVKFYVAGKKGRVIKRFYPSLIAADHEMGHIKTVAFADARAIADDVISRFEADEFDVAHLFYARFQSALVQEAAGRQIIPVAIDVNAAPVSDGGASVEYEPDEEAILAELLPRNVAIQIFGALLENA
ncbi:MAG: ATP synthase F1 subunit gamma, partial [Caldimonas sp.]